LTSPKSSQIQSLGKNAVSLVAQMLSPLQEKVFARFGYMFVQLGDAMLNQVPTPETLLLRVELWLQRF
jgi:hypothetical protein